MKRVQVVIDTGPPERRQHFKVVVEQTANHRARLRILDQTELDRLLYQRQITLDQHAASEHLYRDMLASGYLGTCNWIMDSSIRGSAQAVSRKRANALLRTGLARAWLLAKAGRRTTDYLFGVVLGERKVTDEQVPFVRHGLNTYRSFESWWHGKSAEDPLPDLLRDLPGPIKRTLPFHYQP